MTEPLRMISNSEVGAWLKCRASYRYYYDVGVQPIQNGAALELGSTVHILLEKYYESRMESASHTDSVERVKGFINYAMSQSGADVITLAKATKLVMPYFEYAKEADKNWEILEVEKLHTIPLTDKYVYAMKLDLLIRDHGDMGKVKLVDHKTTYDFWSEDDFALNAQFPKYLGALRFDGLDPQSVIVNQLRTRELKSPTFESLFRRVDIKYPNTSIRRALQEQITSSEQIVAYREMPEERRKHEALRIMNKYNCKGCGVRSLCTAEFQGSDLDYLLATEYKRNEYDASYNGPSAEEMDTW